MLPTWKLPSNVSVFRPHRRTRRYERILGILPRGFRLEAHQASNILPLLRVTVEGGRFAMVFRWMEDGNSEFVRKDCTFNRIALVRVGT